MTAAIVILALTAAICCGLGAAAAWVLGCFGVAVPWYVCTVAWILLRLLFSRGSK